MEHKKSFGFTAIETIIVVALFALIAVAISPLFTAASRSWETDRRLKEMVQKSRDAMDLMTYEIKKSNAIIDGTSANLSTLDVLDAYYVVFSTAGEEYYLDDNNSGYTTNGVAGFTPGTKPGGFAGDYDETSAGYATYFYSFATLLPGDYDIYAYYIATAAVMRLNVFDDSALDYNTTYDQTGGLRFSTTSTGASWDQLNRGLVTPTTRVPVILTGQSGAIGVTKSSGTAKSIADGFKFVYKGFRHKIFYYDTTGGNKITYGSDAFGFAGLVNNPALLSNVQQIGSTPIFTYYQADGVTAATSASNVALVRIQFQIYDPDGKVLPYQLRGQAEIKSEGGSAAGSNTKIVINEINYNPSATTYFSDDMDGNVIVNNVTQPAGSYPDYATYNNWFDNLENQGGGCAAGGWCYVQDAANLPWSYGLCDSIEAKNEPTFDLSGRSMWLTGVVAAGVCDNLDIAKNAAARRETIASPIITMPAIAALGDVVLRDYYSRFVCNATFDIRGCSVTDDADGDCADAADWTSATLCNAAPAYNCIFTTQAANCGQNELDWVPSAAADRQFPTIFSGDNIRIGYQLLSDANKTQKQGIRFENPVIYHTTTTNTNTTVTATNEVTGYKTLWSRGKPDSVTPKTSSLPAINHPACNSVTKCWGTMSRALADTVANRETAQSFNFPEAVNGSIVTPNDATYYIELPAGSNPKLNFYQWRDLKTTNEITANTDGGYVEVCKNGDACFGAANGAGWTRLEDVANSLNPGYAGSTVGGTGNPLNGNGYSTDLNAWTQTTANLSAFLGVGLQKIKIRWHFGSDETGGAFGGGNFTDGHAPGWYIDDIKVREGCAEEWIELYNPTPYAVQVTDSAATCRENASPITCDATKAWSIVLQTHKATDPIGDMIVQYSGDTRYQIPAFGYAVITNKTAVLYTDAECTSVYPIPSTAVKLTIDDNSLGASGLPNTYGLVSIYDKSNSSGALVDQVNYNVVLYDDFETAVTTMQWSTANSGGATSWSTGKLTAGDGMTDNLDHTYSTTSTIGYVFGTKMGAAYDNSSTAYLYDVAIDTTLDTTSATPATLSFYNRHKLDTGDLVSVEQSLDGGGSWSTMTTSSAVMFGAVATTETNWVNIIAAPAIGAISLIRFVLNTNSTAGTGTGWYIDDVAVYWNWGGNGNNRTLERVNWAGSSTAKKNWCESIPANGSPGAVNNPAVCY